MIWKKFIENYDCKRKKGDVFPKLSPIQSADRWRLVFRRKGKTRENLRHVNSSAEEDSMAVSWWKSLKKFPLVS